MGFGWMSDETFPNFVLLFTLAFKIERFEMQFKQNNYSEMLDKIDFKQF